MTDLDPLRHIDVVFDGPPGHESGRFVEVEDANGRSVGNVGLRIKREDLADAALGSRP